MLTKLHEPLFDFENSPILVGKGGKPWTVYTAVMTALVFNNQPKELVDTSIQIASELEACASTGVTEVIFPDEAEQHILTCCKMALHPLIYMRVKQAVVVPHEAEQSSAVMRCN